MGLHYTPATFATDEVVTAAKLNAEIRDALVGLQAEWDTYVPAWTASSPNPSIGNGTIEGYYRRVGYTVQFRVQITMGSTTAYGSGRWGVSLPLAEKAWRWAFGDCLAYSNSSALTFACMASRFSPGKVEFQTDAGTAGNDMRNVDGSKPFTWAAGDVLTLQGVYETSLD